MFQSPFCVACLTPLADHKLGMPMCCKVCWDKLSLGERAVVGAAGITHDLLQRIEITQEHQQDLQGVIAHLNRAIENLSRIIKVPSEELDEAIGRLNKVVNLAGEYFQKRLNSTDDDDSEDSGENWKNGR